MAVNATVNTPRTTKANLSQANTSQVVRVTVPGPKGDAAAATTSLGEIPNVDTSSVQDGSILQYNGETTKWTATNDPSTVAGILYINGGNF
tara:strand:+ start:213 stop:485 length:273 start_codon:yes stop_codon:yes gene_type:complete